MRGRVESLAEDLRQERQMPVMPTPEKKHGSQARAQRAPPRVMLDPVIAVVERLQKGSANQDEFKKMAGAIREAV